MAAGARKLNLEIGFVLFTGQHPKTQGNILLHSILGSRIKIIEGEMTSPAYLDHCDEEMDKMVQEFRAQGRNPCIINSSKSSHISCLGASVYVDLAEELYQQLKDRNIDAQYLVLATSMGATCSGLILGFKLLKYPLRIINLSVTLSKPVIEDKILNVANNTAKFIGVDVSVSPEDIVVYDEYLGKGYGIVSGECLEAMRLMARTEGIFLDPIYTGKAIAGMIDLIRKGKLTSQDTVIFIHTGGLPAIFAYPEEVSKPTRK
jgi:1-aminocyclopropane-1-carboxylate deaminase/D-cysteine desulfhydrase-like pyridoxal-dependent ACC family enzyme